jgi:hypothetical protein
MRSRHLPKLALFYNRLLDRLNAIPGVVSATASSDVLISEVAATGWKEIAIEGSPSAKGKSTSVNYIAPHFFETMHICNVHGRWTCPLRFAQPRALPPS